MTGSHKPRSRREIRSSVNLYGTLKYMTSVVNCRVTNLSPEGLGLKLMEPLHLMRGIPVVFESPELGHLTGSVSWVGRDGTVGLQLKHSTSSSAQVASYFRFFHPTPARASRP